MSLEKNKRWIAGWMALILFCSGIFQTAVYADPDGSLSGLEAREVRAEGEKDPAEDPEIKNGEQDHSAEEEDAVAVRPNDLEDADAPRDMESGLSGLQMTHRAYLNKTKRYLTERFSGEIRISPSGTGKVKDYAIKVRIPRRHLDEELLPSLTISDVTTEQGELKIRKRSGTIDGEEYVLAVDLIQMPDTIHLTMIYDLSLQKRVTPEGFEVTPIVDLYERSGESEQLLSSSSEVTFSAKYDPIVDFDKSIEKHDDGYDRTYRDLKDLLPYGGANDGEHLSAEVDRLEWISFYYSFSTTARNSSTHEIENGYGDRVSANRQYDGNGLLNTRFAESITLTEKLTYRSEDGTTFKAHFDPEKNPGWVLGPDGETVVYRVDAKGDTPADELIYNKPVVLKLKFPNAPVIRPESVGDKSLSGKKQISNEVTAKIVPRGLDPETEEIRTMSDTISIRFFADDLNLSGVFAKRNEEAYHKKVFVGSTHLKEADTRFTLDLHNKTGRAMRHIVLEDFDFDEVFYLRSLVLKERSSSQASDVTLSDIKSIRLIREDRQEIVEIDIPKGSDRKNVPIPLDVEREKVILREVEAVRAGAETEEEVRRVLAEHKAATKLVIEMEDDFVLENGKQLRFEVRMGIRDPFSFRLDQEVTDDHSTQDIHGALLRRFDKPIDRSQQGRRSTPAFDRAKVSFYSDRIATRQEILSKSYVRFSAQHPTMSIRKTNTARNKDGSKGYKVGGNVLYRIDLDISSLHPGMRFKDARFVDLLPEGIRVKSVFHNDHSFKEGVSDRGERFKELFGFSRYDAPAEGEYTALPPGLRIIEDHDRSGRTAVILEAQGDLIVEELQKDLRRIGFVMECVITDKASAENTNRVYFSSRNMAQILDEVQTDPSGRRDRFRSIFDLGEAYEKAVGTSASFDVLVSNSILAQKSISTDKKDWWKGTVNTPFDSDLYYKIDIVNNAEGIGDVVIYDVLPTPNDKNYGPGTARGSRFSNQLTGPVEMIDGSEAYFDVYYMQEVPPSDVRSAIASSEWRTAAQIGRDLRSVKAIKIVQKAGKKLQRSRRYGFILPMHTPEQNELLYGMTETNNFVIFYNDATGGLSNSVSNRLPRKAMISMPTARTKVRVEKRWEGEPASRVIIRLYDGEDEVRSVELNGSYGWQHVFTDLPLTDARGTKKVYTIKEDPVDGYDTLITGDAGSGFVVTNTRQPIIGAGIGPSPGEGVATEKDTSADTGGSIAPGSGGGPGKTVLLSGKDGKDDPELRKAEEEKLLNEMPKRSEETSLKQAPKKEEMTDIPRRRSHSFGVSPSEGPDMELIGDHLTPLIQMLEKRKRAEKEDRLIASAPKTSSRGLIFYIPTIEAIEPEKVRYREEEE
ncbi:MAG: Cna B-type domain-containing protein [Peptostreptococcaceae bacterium]|nr:Cna B-type domain-containing protein [Peptostreptococcaceae bacterium]